MKIEQWGLLVKIVYHNIKSNQLDWFPSHLFDSEIQNYRLKARIDIYTIIPSRSSIRISQQQNRIQIKRITFKSCPIHPDSSFAPWIRAPCRQFVQRAHHNGPTVRPAGAIVSMFSLCMHTHHRPHRLAPAGDIVPVSNSTSRTLNIHNCIRLFMNGTFKIHNAYFYRSSLDGCLTRDGWWPPFNSSCHRLQPKHVIRCALHSKSGEINIWCHSPKACALVLCMLLHVLQRL